MKKYLTVVSMLLTMAACKDPYEVTEPVFNVSTEQTVYAVGERIKFTIEGSPDMINFYSGSNGNDYAYHDKERIYDIVPKLSFRAAKFAGNNSDCAELLYTTDFDGNYTYDNVKAVNWINISNRFTIPPIVGTAASFSDAGTADISDLVVEGKPICFAWHCKTNEASQRTRFQVTDFNVNGENQNDSDLSGVLYSQAQLSFQWVLNADAANQASNKPSVTNTLVYWDGIFDNTAGPLKEGYAVSAPVTISDQINLGLDKPQVIKSIQNENMTEFYYTFDKAGEYEVAFVGYNVNYKGKKEAVKKIKLTIQ
ncbi:DUF5017 domain-containing protein [Pedobacter sp. BS3]|uniref:DUF5017 domain-containing protein n=1 Tax=Pedobacter sp. BS3 TaxID=2567937 RepID=UPI0011EF1759|nr:DUF5017 domain-containing protein [Pedobacter sp. BS3]TZF83003.1 DUF5017 domain-containing protein [Pedobacter sp. BS3]